MASVQRFEEFLCFIGRDSATKVADQLPQPLPYFVRGLVLGLRPEFVEFELGGPLRDDGALRRGRRRAALLEAFWVLPDPFDEREPDRIMALELRVVEREVVTRIQVGARDLGKILRRVRACVGLYPAPGPVVDVVIELAVNRLLKGRE